MIQKNSIRIIILLLFLTACKNISEKKRKIQTDSVEMSHTAYTISDTEDITKSQKTKDIHPYDTLTYGISDEIKKLNGIRCFQTKSSTQYITLIKTDNCNILLNVHSNYKIRLPFKFNISPKDLTTIKTTLDNSEIIIRIKNKSQLLTKNYLERKYHNNKPDEKYNYNRICYDFEHPLFEGEGDTDTYTDFYYCSGTKNYISKNHLNVVKCRRTTERRYAPETGKDHESDTSSSWTYSVNLSTGDYLSTVRFDCTSPLKKHQESLIKEIIDSISYISENDARTWFGDSVILYPFDYFRELKNITRAKEYAIRFSKALKQPLVVTYELCKDKFRDTAIYTGDFIDTTAFYKYKGTRDKLDRMSSMYYHDMGKPHKKNYYIGSGYEAGQLAPPLHFCWSYTGLEETYLMYNVVPMLKEFKNGLWKETNQQILDWLDKYDKLFVITAISTKSDRLISESPVTAPVAFIRVVINLYDQKVIGLFLPQNSTDNNKSCKDYVCPVDSLIKAAPELRDFLDVFPYSVFSENDTGKTLHYWFD